MANELLSALCLVAVLEGLLLFAAPRGWKQLAEQLQAIPDGRLRVIGGVVVVIGLACLWAVRTL